MKSIKNLENAPRIYTVADAARLLRGQEPRIRQAILAGDLPAARIGRLFRIREADLMAYFDRQLVKSRSHRIADGGSAS